MQYNFDEIIDRRGTGSLKWHYSDDTIPLWVADMDFKAAPPILASVQRVTEHGILSKSDQHLKISDQQKRHRTRDRQYFDQHL